VRKTEADIMNHELHSRDKVVLIVEILVTFKEELVGGRAKSKTDEERLLRKG